MNKDLYIQLLEEHVDDLTTAAKIDTVLSLRKTEKLKEFKSELASVSDWNKAQEELISKIADTAMDYQEELNELKIKHIEETQELRAEYLKTLETIKERETRECNENVRLQGKIAGLQSGKTKPQLDPDFFNEGVAVTFNSELEYWSFMELCWGANLEWINTGDPRKSRPKELFLMAHAVSCIDSHLEFATPVYYECELGYEIIKASDYLGVYQ